jgi:D-3-phosphoglycerate dehydrogenase / 2-oxoglutarate reductase
MGAEVAAMDTVQTLIDELLEWIGPGDRPYDEVQEAWRTSCPRLSVWEDAMAAGYLDTRFEPEKGRFVAVSPIGRALLLGRKPS